MHNSFIKIIHIFSKKNCVIVLLNIRITQFKSIDKMYGDNKSTLRGMLEGFLLIGLFILAVICLCKYTIEIFVVIFLGFVFVTAYSMAPQSCIAPASSIVPERNWKK